MEINEYVTSIVSILALIISAYSAVFSYRLSKHNFKAELLRERLEKLERSLEEIHSASDTEDITTALYERMMLSFSAVSKVSSLFSEDKKLYLRGEQRRLNDSYVRYVGEHKGLKFTGNVEGLYKLEDLPKFIAKFYSDVEGAINDEIGNLQKKVSEYIN
jgi:hypothetical protein